MSAKRGGGLLVRMSVNTVLVAATAAGIAHGAAAQEVAEPTAREATPVRRIDPRADEHVRRMSEYLAAADRFAFEAEESFDEVHPNAPRVQLTTLRRAAIERPDRLAADATGDTLNRSTWYDGRTITVLNREENIYSTAELTGTIGQALDEVARRYGVVVPLSDILYDDPYATLLEGALYGEYLGIHQAAGVPCHHLAFSQETIDWQLWIEAGERPLPRKLVITYLDEPGAPQYAATILRWNLEPKKAPDLFTFVAPAGARRVELAELLGSDPEAAAAPPEAPREEGSKR